MKNKDQSGQDLDHCEGVWSGGKEWVPGDSVEVLGVEIYLWYPRIWPRICLAQDKIKSRPNFENINPPTFKTNLKAGH